MSNQLFNAKFIDLDAKTTTKEETIKYLASLIQENLNDKDEYISAVMAREAMSTTGIGEGVAIPHGKSSGVRVPTVAFAKMSNPIDWESLDDEPANLIFLIAVPDGGNNDHLQILKMLAISLMDDDFKEELLKVEANEEAEKLLLERIVG